MRKKDLENSILAHAQGLPESENLLLALEASFEAADVFLKHTQLSPEEILEKSGDRGLVTVADTEAEHLIRSILKQKSPVGILGEEEGVSGSGGDWLWVVDPIDGTTNFSRGIPFSAVSIGLLRNGVPVVGVVYNPFLGECFYASSGLGSYLNGEAIRAVSRNHKGRHVVFVNSGYSPEFELCAMDLSERLRGRVIHRHFGSTAIEICYVAVGRADAFASIGDEIWDYAAAACIAAEAGALLHDWQGVPWRSSRSDLLVCLPFAFSELKEEVAAIYLKHCG